MTDKQSKANVLRAMREANYSAKNSGGGGESGPARTRPSRDGAQVPRGDEGAGLAPGPLEANSVAPQPRGESLQTNATQPSGFPNKRAPRGTFDRNAYQRDLMRKRRAEGKGGYERKTTNPKYKGRPRRQSEAEKREGK